MTPAEIRALELPALDHSSLREDFCARMLQEIAAQLAEMNEPIPEYVTEEEAKK